MLRRRSQEIAVNHDRWLVSYADFVTLLFGFFVVMYSVSQMSETQYQAVSETLSELFSEPNSRERIEAPIDNHVPEETPPASSTPIAIFDNPNTSPIPTLADLSQLRDGLHNALTDLLDQQQVNIEANEHWLKLTLNNRVLFPLGSVTPSSQAEAIMEEVAIILKDYQNPVQVEGFTDNLPINTAYFPSNWELSSARAAAIVKLLIRYGVEPNTLAAVGYGKFHPIADNSTSAGRAENRRVVLMIGREPRQHFTKPEPEQPEQKLPTNTQNISPETKATVPTTTVENPAPKNDENIQPTSGGIKPITLESGDLLFTSDPDRLREANKAKE